MQPTLRLPLRPTRNHQIEPNAPLSASVVRVDKSVAPTSDVSGVEPPELREQAKLEQLRAFQSDLLGRLRRHETQKRQEQRALTSQLLTAQDEERERARRLASHASAEISKALLNARPAAEAPAPPPAEPTPPAPPHERTKLFAQAQQMLRATRDARSALRARARADHLDEEDGQGSDAGTGDEDGGARGADDAAAHDGAAEGGDEAAGEVEGAQPTHPTGRRRQPPHFSTARDSAVPAPAGSARARAHARTDALGDPRSSMQFAPSVSALSSRAATATPVAQWGRTPQALAVFDAMRREHLAAERENARRLAQLRSDEAAERAARRQAAEAQRAREAEAAKAREVEARALSAQQQAAARERSSKVERASRKEKGAQQAARYSDALRALLKERVEQLPNRLPALCACGLHPLEDHVTLCAHNCVYHANPKEYARALSRLLLSNGLGHLLEGTGKQLLGRAAGASSTIAAPRAALEREIGARASSASVGGRLRSIGSTLGA